MFENTPLEQYSTLEELSSVTPVWRPFAHHVDHAQADMHQQETSGDERSS
jgi:hypothetical protein